MPPPPAFFIQGLGFRVEDISLVAHTQDTDAVTPTSFEMCNAEVADIQMIQRTLLVPYAPTTSLCLPVQSGPSLSVSAFLFLHLPNLERCQTLIKMPSIEIDAKP